MIEEKLLNSNILIIDDQPANIEILTGYLEMQGYVQVRSVHDSRKAAAALDEFRPDIILLDLTMPHLSGFEVLKYIRAWQPENSFLPVLVLTADINAESKKQALSGGASDFLTKPFDLTEVGLRIRNLLFTRYLYMEMLNQNQNLEEKVKERTLELEQTNLELTVARNKAEESDRLKTAFLNNISHEIRTPFNGILGFLSLLQEDGVTTANRDEYISTINQSADRLLKTISDIVEIAKIQAGQVAFESNETLIRAVAGYLSSRFEGQAVKKNLAFQIRLLLEAHHERILTDEQKLSTILASLVDNAIKFTRKGSVTVSIESFDQSLRFTVEDTGQGIPPEKQDIIFERFLQGDFSNTRQFEGTGLGLSIARAYTETIGGRLSLESTPGKGSRFILTLPAQSLKSDGESASVSTRASALPASATVLVAEDDQINFDYVATVLRKAGYQVIQAVTGSEAIDICRNNADVNMVLMDIRMPDIDGYSATREIRVFNPELPIIAVTAYALPGEQISARAAGCTDYLAKPVKRDTLLSTVRKYLSDN